VDISDALLRDKRVDRLGKKRDVQGLIDLLEHGDGHLPAIAAHELGLLGDAGAVEPLLRRFRRIDLSSAIEDEEYEWVCLARALGRLTDAGSPAAGELLEELERPERREFRIAALALANTGDRRAIEPLVRLLGSVDPNSLAPGNERDAEYAIDALGMLKAPEAVDALIDALEIESLREDTANALGDIGDPRAVPALAALLEPEPPLFVENAIWNALNQIGTPEAKAAITAWEERGDTRRTPANGKPSGFRPQSPSRCGAGGIGLGGGRGGSVGSGRRGVEHTAPAASVVARLLGREV